MSPVTTRTLFADTVEGQLFIKCWTLQQIAHPEPVVLLHDSLGCIGLWRDFPALLAAQLGREVMAYDRLGFGQSSASAELLGASFIDDEAERYFPAVKAALNLKHYILFGHSVGGGMAIAIAARDTDCKGVIAESSQAFVEAITLQGIRDAQANFANPEQLSRLQKWHGDKALFVLHSWRDVWLDDSFADWSLDAYLRNLSCPVLAIHGDGDEFGSAAFPAFISERAAAGGQMILLDNCGHVPHKEKRDVVLRHVSDFIQSLS